jgi:hypothetical protein
VSVPKGGSGTLCNDCYYTRRSTKAAADKDEQRRRVEEGAAAEAAGAVLLQAGQADQQQAAAAAMAAAEARVAELRAEGKKRKAPVQQAERGEWSVEQHTELLGMRQRGWGEGSSGGGSWVTGEGPCAGMNRSMLDGKWRRLVAAAGKATDDTRVVAGSGSNKRQGLVLPPGFWQAVREQAQAEKERKGRKKK